MMLILRKFKLIENPEHPSLGFLLRMMTLCGLWHPELKSLKSRLKLALFYVNVIFFCTQYFKCALNFNEKSVREFLQHTPFHLGVMKWFFFQMNYKSWEELVSTVSAVERKQFAANDVDQQNLIKNYVRQSRRVIYFYMGMACVADISIYTEPYLRNQAENDVYHYIFETYSPFRRQPPWYYCTMFFQTFFGFTMSFYVVCWDLTSITLMIYFAGQMRVSGLYCTRVIDGASVETSWRNIAECHEFHRNMITSLEKFNSLISPVMFLYLIIISVNLGACIIQITELENDLTTLLASCIYTVALLIELLLFYWHSNEVTVQSECVSYNTFRSDWVGVDPKLQRQVLLLAFTTSKRVAFRAGPFNEMTLATFILILRGTYSFYTLLKETS